MLLSLPEDPDDATAIFVNEFQLLHYLCLIHSVFLSEWEWECLSEY